uniref:Uncharacterized protein n=1 Tax=Cucumis melo TaxID=3656 RepID=A0A9I9EAB0_CUCME
MAMIRGLEVNADYLVHVSLPYVFVESDYGSLVNIVTHKAIVLLEMTKFVYETVSFLRSSSRLNLAIVDSTSVTRFCFFLKNCLADTHNVKRRTIVYRIAFTLELRKHVRFSLKLESRRI